MIANKKAIKLNKTNKSNRLSVNPSTYVTSYDKGMTGQNINKAKKKSNIGSIILVILIVLGVIGVILVVLHFETDIFKPPTQTPSLQTTIETIEPQKPEVFLVEEQFPKNETTLNAVCDVFNSQLATYNQLLTTAKSGAKWCRYGWIKGNADVNNKDVTAYYPNNTNENKENNAECIEPDNPDIPLIGPDPKIEVENYTLGVNCYGVKPTMNDEFKEKIRNLQTEENNMLKKQEKEDTDFRDTVGNSGILPFNADSWSSVLDNEDYLDNNICDSNNENC